MRKKYCSGQSYVEFAALIVIVIGVLIVMKVYIMRSFEGKYHRLADQIGSQYDPNAVNITSTETTNTTTNEYTAYGVNADNSTNYQDEIGSVIVSNTNISTNYNKIVNK